MPRFPQRTSRGLRHAAATAAALTLTAASATACSGSGDDATTSVPHLNAQQEIGPAEGSLDLVVWAGYAEDGTNDKTADWVTPFEKASGCRVNAKIADTSDSMVALMKTGRYDGVSASGDASLRLVYGGDVVPVNTGLLTEYGDIAGYLKNQSYNSINGQMYGVPHGYGANLLMYRTDMFSQPPTSWNVVWDTNSQAAGHVAAYDSPIYIADAALYLRAHKPSLKIKDPYALNDKQFDAAVDLLKKQRPNINQYWHNYLDEVQSFKSGDNHAGTAWQVIANVAKSERAPVATTLPAEGATGWSDTWMLSSKAQHPNCMYRWMNWITKPQIQAQVAQYFGEAPANPKACRFTAKGFCADFHVGDDAFYQRLAFWRTPTADCGKPGKSGCVDYSRWTQAWTQIKG
ncbi:ABC transporter substrate-binding protein [Actinomadura barringtoniae]|uniref:ABC transporter substrate-binding protein n=1 Tax=Actinomadura barringtoniae TaxID=1427535 RepID=A0A939P8T1_9ACTN|nr:ABC transporter substrate-binding protein [Actinomadura barringtoniae]MBO2448152.1 ABC transporter substrate-binding protein [Actinomadura barringtoniae]